MDIKKLYFQKQNADDDCCRVCAINNAIGKNVLSLKRFNSLCDEFDKKYKCSGSKTFFIVTLENNSLCYVLNKLGIRSVFYAPGTLKHVNGILEKSEAFLVFSSEHIWACRKYNNVWYTLDSIRKKIVPLRKNDINSTMGFIVLNQ